MENRIEDGASSLIGVMDSGLGGLAILRELVDALPGTSFIYAADQRHMPYGSRSTEEIRAYCAGIAEFFLSHGAGMMVVACNTASAAALRHLRQIHPGIPFVGMEPAVKPAVRISKKGRIGVLATQSTLSGDLFTNTVKRFAGGVEVFHRPCPGLAEAIENPATGRDQLAAMLKGWIDPLLAEGVDCLVLACTHYPLVIDIIRSLAGPAVQVIDPAPAIAERVKRLLAERHAVITQVKSGRGRLDYYTNGSSAAFDRAASAIMRTPVASRNLEYAVGRNF